MKMLLYEKRIVKSRLKFRRIEKKFMYDEIEDKEVKLFIKKGLRRQRSKIAIITAISFILAILAMFNPLIEQFIIDTGFVGGKIEGLIAPVLILVVSMICINILSTVVGLIQQKLNLDIEQEMKVKAFEHAINLELSYIRKYGFFKIIEDAEYDISRIAQIFSCDLLGIFWQIFMFIGCVLGLIILNRELALVLVISVPLKYLVYYLTNRKRKIYSEKLLSINKDISKWKNGIYEAINEIKLWNLHKRETGMLNGLYIKCNESIRKLYKLDTCMDWLTNGIDSIVTGIIFLYGGLLIWKNEITIGSLFAFITYMSYFVDPVFYIINLTRTISKISPSIKSYLAFTKQKEEKCTDAFDGSLMNAINDRVIHIEFKDVSFSFDDKVVFDNLNLDFKTGEIVKIDGENGSGKSTLINLLLKLYTPDAGNIYLNGVDIQKIPNTIYRELFAVMYQNVYLFNGTISENITMGDITKDITEGVELLEFAEKFPEKLETSVGINGIRLSGGEKQRVALVRTINKNSPILILDEGTSNCDVETKKYMDEFIKLNKFNLVIIVSHSNLNMNGINRILDIHNGIISEKRRK